MKILFKTFYYFVIVLLFLIAGSLFLSVIPESRLSSFVVLSGSMEPKIKTGSVVFSLKKNDYFEGEVITFQTKKTTQPVTHRIVEKTENGFVTKGDANNSEDNQEITESKIIGKVVLAVPYLGYAVNATQKPLGFVLIIIVPAVVIIYDELLNIKKEVLKKIEKRKNKMKNKKEQESKEVKEKNEN